MREILDNIANKVKNGEEPDFKALEVSASEDADNECTFDQVHICYNDKTKEYIAQ